MAYDLYQAGILIGSAVRCRNGVFAYDPEGAPIGEFADLDAAAAALSARMQREPAHAA